MQRMLGSVCCKVNRRFENSRDRLANSFVLYIRAKGQTRQRKKLCKDEQMRGNIGLQLRMRI